MKAPATWVAQKLRRNKRALLLADTVQIKETRLTWLALFTTTGTLVCCALPVVMVTLGLGASLASIVNAIPFLMTLSQHKTWVFLVSGLLLVLSGWVTFRIAGDCPADSELGRLCSRSQIWNRRIFWFSISLWVIGFLAAFLALPFQIWLDN